MSNINYSRAEQDINDTGMQIKFKDGRWQMTKDGVSYYDAFTKEQLIEAYFNHDMSDYCNSITIEQFVEQNIILCVSMLIYELTQKGCLDEEIMIELHEGGIDYSAAEYQLEADNCYPLEVPCPEDGNYYYRWGIRTSHGVWKIEPIHEDKESAIEDYFENYLGGSLCEYRHEVFEHWVVSSYLAARLRQKGETVVSLWGLTIYCRCTTGMSLKYDDVIQEVHAELIEKYS